MGVYLTPKGTDTINSFSVALRIFDSNPLKNTLLSIMLGLKSFPLIVIVLPIPPNAGSIESMTGWEKINDIKNNIDDIYLNILKSTNDYPKI
jgi:hypothetical protein